jgi:hypothetical protein
MVVISRKQKLLDEFNLECLPKLSKILEPFSLYFEGKPLPDKFQNPSELIKERENVTDILCSGSYEELVLNELFRFIQKIVQEIIKPQLQTVEGDELVKLVKDFWERF